MKTPKTFWDFIEPQIEALNQVYRSAYDAGRESVRSDDSHDCKLDNQGTGHCDAPEHHEG